MKKITALNMNWNEYSEVVDKATESKATQTVNGVTFVKTDMNSKLKRLMKW